MKCSFARKNALTPLIFLLLGTLTACGGSDSPAPAPDSPTPTIDTTAPVITLNGSESVEHTFGDVYTDLGVTATDNIDDASDIDISVTELDVAASLGTKSLTYTATDSAGNTSTVSRTIIVKDLTAPVITLVGDATITHNGGVDYSDAGATATDNVDDTITITTSGSVDITNPNSYTITYSATDAAGNEATPITRTVDVVDITAPVITLNGDATIDHNFGDVYTDLGAAAIDNVDTTITAITTDVVNVNAIGINTLTYSATDAAGNVAEQVERTVTVVDSAPPVITLNGESEQTIFQYTTYLEKGATALDVADGAIPVPAPIEVVDMTTPGDYLLTYTVTDTSGNKSELIRTVTVIEQRPFITTWKTDNVGGTDDNQIKIGTNPEYSYNYRVDWGDGNISEGLTGDYVHTYDSAGTYTGDH